MSEFYIPEGSLPKILLRLHPEKIKSCKIDFKVNFAFNEETIHRDLHYKYGTVSGYKISTLVTDTECTCIAVSEDLIPKVSPTHEKWATLYDYLGRGDRFPIANYCSFACN